MRICLVVAAYAVCGMLMPSVPCVPVTLPFFVLSWLVFSRSLHVKEVLPIILCPFVWAVGFMVVLKWPHGIEGPLFSVGPDGGLNQPLRDYGVAMVAGAGTALMCSLTFSFWHAKLRVPLVVAVLTILGGAAGLALAVWPVLESVIGIAIWQACVGGTMYAVTQFAKPRALDADAESPSDASMN